MTITLQMMLGLILGLIICFFGYKLKKLAFAIAWFLIGYTLCARFAPDLVHNLMPQLESPDLWITVLPIAVGLLLSLMGLSVERLCVGTLTFVVVVAIMLQQFGFSWPLLGVACIIGVVAGCVAVSMMKPAVIVITAFAGAQSVAAGLISAITAIPAAAYLPILIVLAVCGTLYQFRANKGQA